MGFDINKIGPATPQNFERSSHIKKEPFDIHVQDTVEPIFQEMSNDNPKVVSNEDFDSLLFETIDLILTERSFVDDQDPDKKLREDKIVEDFFQSNVEDQPPPISRKGKEKEPENGSTDFEEESSDAATVTEEGGWEEWNEDKFNALNASGEGEGEGLVEDEPAVKNADNEVEGEKLVNEPPGELRSVSGTSYSEENKERSGTISRLSERSGIAKGTPTSTGSSNQVVNRSLAWRLYKGILKVLPRGFLSKAFSRFAIRDGRLKITDIEPERIPKLSSRLLQSLSDDQVRQLDYKQLDQLSQNQLFAIGPKLDLLGAEKMAHVINRLASSDDKKSFLNAILDNYEQGNVDVQDLKKLFEDSSLQQIDLDSFKKYFRLTSSKINISVDPSYITGLLNDKDITEPSMLTMPLQKLDGSTTDIPIYKRSLNDMHRGRHIINDQDFDPQKKLGRKEKVEALLTRVNEATLDPSLTQKIQALMVGPDVVSGLSIELIKTFASTSSQLFPDVSNYYFNVHVDSPQKSPTLISIEVILDVTVKHSGLSDPLGFSQAIMRFTIPSEDLNNEDMKNAKLAYVISPIFAEPPNKLSPEDTFDRKRVVFDALDSALAD